MKIDEPRLKAEADHLELVLQIEQLLRSSGVALLDQEYWYEGFGTWTLMLSRGGRQYQVGFDGRERSLDFKVLYDGVPAHITPELAEERLERLGPEAPQQVHAFTTRQIDRAEAGEFVLGTPVVSREPSPVRRSRLFTIGPWLVLGSVFAAIRLTGVDIPPSGLLRTVHFAKLGAVAVLGLTGVAMTFAGWLRNRRWQVESVARG